ncbi:MAG: DUF547 domain-containing protein [Polyangiales bacterium]
MSASVLNDDGASVRPEDAVSLSRSLVQATMALGRDRAALPEVCSLAAHLRSVDVRPMPSPARLAFWLNVYNALDRHAIVLGELRGSLVSKVGLFSKARYRIGAHALSLNEIEHGLLRMNRRPPLSVFRTLDERDERRAWAPSELDPRVHFALNCGARSCPAVRPYDAESVDAALEAATREYFALECSVDQRRATLTLPFLLRMYRADFGDERAMVAFAERYASEEIRSWIASTARVRVRFASYDWTIIE